MVDPKPITAWAYVSLATGMLAWLAAAPLPFIDYQQIAGATAGVGLAVPFLLGQLSALLCFLGLIFAVVALARTGSGRLGGHGRAWAGVAINGLLLVAYAAVAGLFLVGSDVWQR
jgi:hypothetical protein